MNTTITVTAISLRAIVGDSLNARVCVPTSLRCFPPRALLVLLLGIGRCGG